MLKHCDVRVLCLWLPISEYTSGEMHPRDEGTLKVYNTLAVKKRLATSISYLSKFFAISKLMMNHMEDCHLLWGL
jgi:hypothetical protein